MKTKAFLPTACLLAFTLEGLSQDTQVAPSVLTIPQGTQLVVDVTRPVVSATAHPSDPVYTVTVFPVTVGNAIAIPPGTYVLGRIDGVVRPTRRSAQAQLQMHIEQIIFANGYTLSLSGSAAASPTQVTIRVSAANDLLLDNGAQLELTLAAPLVLDPGQVARALPLSHAPAPGSFRTATQCVPEPGDPGSPGTPDTVIPGTPGTPPTVIPGADGSPPTVIPGTPGTPPTIIHGIAATPGTAPTVCPAPPLVLSSAPVFAAIPAVVASGKPSNP